ncbi:ABC transporter ATP-binding protein [Paraburkholderia sp. HD33-4]|uniref:ABC transporter ATP-binding protein n=1 Tax=Paraburkholderia sp. HD33-4 TaxID=2883242 RepID=UPI001F305CA6|nr:ABC transporter ATP-binding protein [Paraburkholderia sp. HD33-4]
MMQATELHAYYEKSHILQGMSFMVDDGEVVCLLGRNGVGKSTTLKSMMGLVKLASGSVVFNGKDISNLATHSIARLGFGYVPEERRIFPTISVKENLLMGMKDAPPSVGVMNGNRWTLERVYQFLPRLRERAAQRAGTLSGGEQQMLCTGRALMGNPSLLLVDEPTEGLAPAIVTQVEEILSAAHRDGTAILLVDQTMGLALSLGSRFYVMSKGRIVFAGGAVDLMVDKEVRKRYLEL